jgi:hypothetical protein
MIVIHAKMICNGTIYYTGYRLAGLSAPAMKTYVCAKDTNIPVT